MSMVCKHDLVSRMNVGYRMYPTGYLCPTEVTYAIFHLKEKHMLVNTTIGQRNLGLHIPIQKGFILQNGNKMFKPVDKTKTFVLVTKDGLIVNCVNYFSTLQVAFEFHEFLDQIPNRKYFITLKFIEVASGESRVMSKVWELW